ncbi:hypothetical protein [Castellaniella sp. GW247-6E4]|uniref:hypothetical protein n=1 Tax=Castellaniella sp. GW247-6E4 TaxID=3140380 RepID=UPI003315F107
MPAISQRRQPMDSGRALRIATRALVLVAAAFVAVLLVRAVGGLIIDRGMARQQALEKAAIERCLEDQNADFNSIEQRRFARAACTRMRNDYRQRYGEKL